MKGRLWKAIFAACFALLLVSGNVVIQPVAGLFGNMVVTVNAANGDVVDSGNCGAEGHESDVTWVLTHNNDDNDNPTYTLTINGTGNMANYDFATQPWHKYMMYSNTSVEIKSGITSIGNSAFRDCTGKSYINNDSGQSYKHR